MPDKKAVGPLDRLHIWLFARLNVVSAAASIALFVGVILMVLGSRSGSPFLMLVGCVLFLLSLFVDVVLGRIGRSSIANEKEEARKTVDVCKKLLSEINEEIYGSDDDAPSGHTRHRRGTLHFPVHKGIPVRLVRQQYQGHFRDRR